MTKEKQSGPVDLKKALLDPGSVFAAPEDVISHPSLKQEDKIEILRRWAYDATELSVAGEEGMPGGNDDLLRQVLLALNKLTGGLDLKQTGPTKHKGLSRSSVKPK